MESLTKTKQWLQNQLVEHKAVAIAQTEKDPDDDLEDILQRVIHLQKTLQEVSSINSVKEMIIEQTQMGQELKDMVCPPRDEMEAASGDKVQQQPDHDVVTLLETQEQLSTGILRFHQAIHDKQSQLDKLRKENLELKASSRELMANLESLKEEQRTHSSLARTNDNIARLQERMDKFVAKTEVLRGVFRRLIIGSGIDWAADKQLTERLMDLGTPLDIRVRDGT